MMTVLIPLTKLSLHPAMDADYFEPMIWRPTDSKVKSTKLLFSPRSIIVKFECSILQPQL